MTDFYSVLKSSIVQRNLRSPAARQDVYEQAREAMIRRLWSLQPPLSADDIDARIDLFDDAVEKIEDDLTRSFAATADDNRPRSRAHDQRQAPAAERIRPPPAYEEPVYDDDVRGEPDDGDLRRRLPAVIDISSPGASAHDDAYRSNGYDDVEYEQGSYQRSRYEEAAYVEYDDQDVDDPYDAPPPTRRGRRSENGRTADEEDYMDEFEPPAARRRPASRRSGKSAKAKGGQKRRSGRSVPILAITIGALAVILVGFNLYVFLPILMGSEPAQSTAAPSPMKIEDRLPSLDAAGASTRIVSNSATAVEIPERSLDVAESLVIFDGGDPTVFEGTSNNPIQFDSDSEGGFARISSAASAAGARAVIGPGLADRLAGRTVRVTLLARSSNENGAAKMRFAYQSGLAVSHWQSADLSPNYGTYGIIWRVPAADTGDRGYLLIEPGIPGDGTSTDIRMIRIDILNS